MASAFMITLTVALESSLSVLLTISYGVIAAKLDMIGPATIKDVSILCANIFLPSLLFSNVGGNVTLDKIDVYGPVFVWSLTYTLISMGLGKAAARWWGLPSWTVAAITFNNTASLPLLLTKSLATTGLLSSITGHKDISKVVEQATSYYLVNSLVAKLATFAIGPYLFEKDSLQGQTPDMSPIPPPILSERTGLLSKRSLSPLSLPNSTTHFTKQAFLSFSPITWSAILAALVGFCPPLQRLFFSNPQDGGYLSAWVSESLQNIGSLFAVLQIFIVGAKLSRSFQSEHLQVPVNPPAKALIAIFFIRIVLWSFLSTAIIYFLAVNTDLLPHDPLMWWCMILMPIGPPAMTLSTLVEVINLGQTGKHMLSRTLAFMYTVTPVMSLAVVGALKACEHALEQKGGFKT